MLPGTTHGHLWTPGISSLCSSRKCQCHVNGFYFLPHHASRWKATRFNGGLQRGCLPVPHRGLCAVTLRQPGLEGGVRARLGVGKEGKTSKLAEPPVDLGFFLHPPTFSTFVFSFFFCIVSLSPLFNHVTDKAGPEDDWAQAQNWRVPAGLSEAATEVT